MNSEFDKEKAWKLISLYKSRKSMKERKDMKNDIKGGRKGKESTMRFS